MDANDAKNEKCKYEKKKKKKKKKVNSFKLADTGIEPATLGLLDPRSNQLS